MDDKECPPVELKGQIRFGKAKEVKVKSSQRRPLVVWQTDNIEDIVTYVWKSGNSVYPCHQQLNQTEGHDRQLRERIGELADGKFAYVTRSLRVSANVGLKHSYLEDVDFDVFLTELNTPAVVFSVLKDDNITEAAKNHISGLVKEIVALIRKFTDERFSAVFGLLLPKDLTSKSAFKEALSRIKQETGKLSTPESLAMSSCKQSKVVRALISGMALTSSVFIETQPVSPSFWFLTLEQFRTLIENIDCKVVNIITHSSSGGKTLSLEVLKRLEQSGPSLLISNDEEILERARKLQTAYAVQTPDDLKTMKESPSNIENIVTHCDPDLVPDLMHKFPSIRYLWKFSKYRGDGVQECEASLQTSAVPMDDSEVTEPRDGLPDSSHDFEKEKSENTNESNETTHHLETSSCAVTADIARWTSKVTRTGIVDRVIDKLKVSRWVTITGLQGEGKTTLGYMVLKEMKEKGNTVWVPRTPTDYQVISDTKSTLKQGKSIFMLDDIFGDVVVNPSSVRLWYELISNLHDPNIAQRNNEQFLFICNTNISEKVGQYFSRHQRSIVNSDGVNLSTHDEENEAHRSVILDRFVRESHMYLNESDRQQISRMELNHGFPHTCKLFVQFGKEGDTDGLTFFSNPLRYLDAKTETHLRKSNTLELFKHIAASGGIESKANIEFIQSAEQTDSELPDVYLKMEHDLLVFSHPTIFERVVLGIGRHDPKFVIQNCEAVFVAQRTKRQTRESNDFDYIYIDENDEEVMKLLVKPFASTLRMGLFEILRHEMCNHPSFCREVIAELAQETESRSRISGMDGPGTLDQYDVQGYTLLHVAVKWYNVPAIHALIDNGADVKLQCTDILNSGKTALHFLCERSTLDEKILKLLLKQGYKVNTVDGERRPVLHYLCMAARDRSSLQLLLRGGADTNIQDEYGKTALHYLFGRTVIDMDLVRLVIKHKSKINAIDKWEKTVLHYACEREDLSINVVSYLIQEGSNVNMSDKWSNTALHLAADNRRHDSKVFEFLVKHGSSINAANQEGNTPLHLLCKQNRIKLDAISLLIKHGADVNMADGDGRTVLTGFCEKGVFDSQIGKMLIEGGADVNKTDSTGNTALHYWCMKGNEIGYLDKLLSSKADVTISNQFGKTPLHYVCERKESQSGTVKVLIDQGANINATDRHGKTPLIDECEEGSAVEDIVILLVDSKADVNITDIYKKTALHYLCERGTINKFLFEVLVQNGADINKKDEHDYTVLHYCCLRGDSLDVTDLADLFLNLGSDIHSSDQWGRTPLHCYCEGGNVDSKVIDFMVKKGATVNVKDRFQKTLLHAVCEYHPLQSEIIELLIQNKADTRMKDVNGRTPLHLVCDHTNINLRSIEVLVKGGTSINATDENGKTPLHYICENRNTEEDVVRVFLKHNADLHKTDSKGISPLQYLLKQPALRKLVEGYTFRNNAISIHRNKGDENGFEGISRDLNAIQKHDVNMTDVFGMTLLHYACREAKINMQIVRYIIDHSLDVNLRDTDQMTPLHIICRRTDVPIYTTARLLIQKEANIKLTDKTRNTPLHYVCKRPYVDMQHVELITELMERGADVNQMDNKGMVVLHYLTMSGSGSGIRSILPKVSDINVPVTHDVGAIHKGQTALHIACISTRTNTVLVTELLRNKASTLTTDRKGRTPLHYICQKPKRLTYDENTTDWSSGRDSHSLTGEKFREQQMQIAKLLLDQHKLFKKKRATQQRVERDQSSDSGLGATSDIATRDQGQSEAKVSRAVERYVNMRDNSGCSALQYLCRNDIIHRDLFRLLSKQSTDMSQKDYEGITVLHSLVLAGELSLLKFIEKKVDQHFDMIHEESEPSSGFQVIPTGQTLLHLACRTINAKLEIVKLLLNYVDKDAKDCYGKSPLHYICEEPQQIVWDQTSYELVIRSDTTLTDDQKTGLQKIRLIIAKALLQRGCDRRVTDVYGVPALHGPIQAEIENK